MLLSPFPSHLHNPIFVVIWIRGNTFHSQLASKTTRKCFLFYKMTLKMCKLSSPRPVEVIDMARKIRGRMPVISSFPQATRRKTTCFCSQHCLLIRELTTATMKRNTNRTTSDCTFEARAPMLIDGMLIPTMFVTDLMMMTV